MQIDGKMEQNDHTFFFKFSLLHSSNCHIYMYSANESSTYMTSVGKGGAGAPAKGLAPAHFFPLEGPGHTHYYLISFLSLIDEIFIRT